MRAARFDVSGELLASVLHLPSSASVIGARMSPRDPLAVELIVDDPILPEADEPHVSQPILTKESVKWDWNLPS